MESDLSRLNLVKVYALLTKQAVKKATASFLNELFKKEPLNAPILEESLEIDVLLDEKFEEKSNRVFITFKNTTRL